MDNTSKVMLFLIAAAILLMVSIAVRYEQLKRDITDLPDIRPEVYTPTDPSVEDMHVPLENQKG